VFFTGKPYDADLGAYLFNYRSYDPALCRWTTPDPSGFPDGANNWVYAPVPTTGIDPLGLHDNHTLEEELLAVYIHTQMTALVTIRMVPEIPFPSDWNYKGFNHWLLNTGAPVELPWEAFDKDYQASGALMMSIFTANHALAKSTALGLSIGSSSLFSPVLPSLSDGLISRNSHNPWISSYEAFIGAISNVNVTRISDARAELTVAARLYCRDYADFNPGEKFGPWSMFDDDSFIFLEHMGVASDYRETSYKDFSYSRSIIIE
jgi:RHS repeat-associated protein